MELILLCLAAFAAGFIDAIVGGGGLLQTPATLLILPHYPVATLLGTTKIPSLAGTTLALLKGNKFIRVFFLIVVFGMILRFAYDILK